MQNWSSSLYPYLIHQSGLFKNWLTHGLCQGTTTDLNGHLMRRVDSLEKTLMLGGIGGRRKREFLNQNFNFKRLCLFYIWNPVKQHTLLRHRQAVTENKSILALLRLAGARRALSLAQTELEETQSKLYSQVCIISRESHVTFLSRQE